MTKTKKNKVVEAYPQVSLFSSIQIEEKEETICIGGFTVDGGFYLKSPYELVKEERNGLIGDVTYYNVVKNGNKMCEHEKALRQLKSKRKAEDLKWEKNRTKELKEELARLEKEKKQ